MKLAIFSLVFCFTLGCALTQKKQPLPAAPNVKNELAKIEIDIAAGAHKKAVKHLEKIIATQADTDAADDAAILLGQVYFKSGAYDASYKAYISVINSDYFSPRETDAAIGAANALYKLGRYDEALSLSQKALKFPELSTSTKLEIHLLRYNLQTQMGDRIEALRSLVLLAQTTPENEKRERYRIKAVEVVESSLTEDELKTVADESSFAFVRGSALYRVGVLYFEQRDYSRAENYFETLVKTAAGTDLATNAQNYLEQIAARRRVAPYTIGAVLPLSGRHAAIAQKTLRGLRMGLGLNGKSSSDFKLAVIDSEANPDAARRAVERLVIEDSTVAIVGDLLSRTAEPVAQKADELGVPVIGLSQKSGITQIGPNVFRNALTSAALVRELVKNSIEKYGIRRFAILYPNDPYGVEYANIFWDEVLARGGQITAVQTYSPSEKDFSGPVSRLVGTYYLEDRADEYTQLVKTWYGQQKAITSRITPPTDLLPPIVNFEALFIPDAVKALGQIASMLVYSDITSVRLLGTNLWNSDSIVARGTNLIQQALFVDAKCIVDNSLNKTSFSREYRAIYGEEPTVFEAQAYDTGVALRTAIERGARSRIAVREALEGMKSFQGTVGEITVTEEREFTRPLALLTVMDGKIRIAPDPVDASTH